MSETQGEITRLLDAWSDGDPQALDELMPLVLDDLHRIASRYLAQEGNDHTLQPTALVNEVYLRIVGRRTVAWRSKAQFFGYLAELMRHILVDHARSHLRARRGSGALKLSLDEAIRLPDQTDPDLLALDDALNDLASMDPRQSRVVELRYFVGLTIEETAEVMKISPRTVKREWRTARLWLFRELSRE